MSSSNLSVIRINLTRNRYVGTQEGCLISFSGTVRSSLSSVCDRGHSECLHICYFVHLCQSHDWIGGVEQSQW